MFARPSSLFVVLLASTLALAVPIPIGEGDVVMVKPKHLDPKGSSNVGRHPAVVVSNPDADNKVKVAVVSNNHPEGTVTKPAENYGLRADTGHINLGTPHTAKVENVKLGTLDPKLSEEHLNKLKGDINENCGETLVRRDDGTLLYRRAKACNMRPKPAANKAAAKSPPKAAPKVAAKAPVKKR